MDELTEVKTEIAATKAKLAKAEVAENEALILMLGNNLAELRRKENRLEERQGKL